MTLPVIIRAECVADLEEGRDWYESRQAGLGQRFRASMNVLIAAITSNPKSFSAGYRGVRKAMRRPFPYVVYYRILTNCVDVFAIQHGRRHPSAWTNRLP